MSKEKRTSQDEQRQFWRMVFETHRQSGLSISTFCRQEGLTEPAYYYWRKKHQEHQAGRTEDPGGRLIL